jgi:hypothetical protein
MMPTRRSPGKPADGEDGEDFGAHGIFEQQSHEHDPQLWASHHHGLLGIAAAAVATAAVLICRRP